MRSRLGVKMAGKSFPEPWLVVDIKAKALGVPVYELLGGPEGVVVTSTGAGT